MEKDDAVRAAILEAAEKLLQRWGIAKTTMEDIAREAGKGKSTLYYYFKSKRDILEAVALAEIARIAGIARQEIAKKDTAKEKLVAYFYATLKEIREATTLFDIAFGEVRADKTLISGIQHKVDMIDYSTIESILHLGIERGEFKSIGPGDLETTIRAIGAIKRSLTIDLLISSNDRQLIDSILNLLSEGLS
jgi:AcrR family transcriptional regulator